MEKKSKTEKYYESQKRLNHLEEIDNIREENIENKCFDNKEIEQLELLAREIDLALPEEKKDAIAEAKYLFFKEEISVEKKKDLLIEHINEKRFEIFFEIFTGIEHEDRKQKLRELKNKFLLEDDLSEKECNELKELINLEYE